MSYFEFIQRASVEKTHSAAIAWILSDKNNMSRKQREEIYMGVFNIKLVDSDILVCTEYKGIDILIRNGLSIIAIENKIKISEHDNQLFRYDDILKQEFDNNYKVHKYYLSLLGEEPDNKKWKVITYDDLLKFLKICYGNNEIVDDYISNLDRLISIKNEFNKEHRKFKSVFKDGSLKKSDKLNKYDGDENLSYIALNNLETILQRYFMSKIMMDVKEKFKIKKVGETRGIALIDLKKPVKISQIIISGKEVDIGIQIQGKAIKIQFENGYYDNGIKKNNDIELCRILDDNIAEIYSKFDNKIWRLNRHRNPNSAYFSISKKIDFDKSKGFEDYKYSDCTTIINNEVDICIKTLINNFA